MKTKDTLNIPDFVKTKFRGGYIKETENDVQYHLFTYQKLGLIDKILSIIIDRAHNVYRINISMTVSHTSSDKNSIKLFLAPITQLPSIAEKGIIIKNGRYKLSLGVTQLQSDFFVFSLNFKFCVFLP